MTRVLKFPPAAGAPRKRHTRRAPGQPTCATDDMIEDRGVYWRPMLVNGRPSVYAVAADGNCLAEAFVRNNDEAAAVVDALWNLLDALDPVRLKIEREDCP